VTSNFAYRYVSLTPEHTTVTGARSYGTKSAMTASGALYGEVDDESFALNFDLLTRADMSRYGAAKSVNGKEYSEGGMNLVMQPDDTLGLLLYAMYGDNTTVDSTGYGISGFVHTWKEVKDLILPSFTIEVGREEKEHTYTGMCLSSLSISASHGEYATISADFTGKSESAVSTLVAGPTFGGAALDGFHFANGTVAFSSAGASSTTVTNVKSVSLEFNMNLDTDAACSIGSRTYIRQPQPQMREITGTIEFSNANTSSADGNTPDYETALGTGGALWDGAASHPAVQLDFTNGTQSLAIEIRKVRWEAPQQNVSGRDTSTLTMSFVALVDVADEVMSTCVLTHTAASSALATGVKYSKA
jgi:hypothetical protein